MSITISYPHSGSLKNEKFYLPSESRSNGLLIFDLIHAMDCFKRSILIELSPIIMNHNEIHLIDTCTHQFNIDLRYFIESLIKQFDLSRKTIFNNLLILIPLPGFPNFSFLNFLNFRFLLTIFYTMRYYEYSMMAVGQVCPHRLVVQDISLSRRQRGFDFPWG